MKPGEILTTWVYGCALISFPGVAAVLIDVKGLEDTALHPFEAVLSTTSVALGVICVAKGLMMLKRSRDGVHNEARGEAFYSYAEETSIAPKVTLATAPSTLADRADDRDLQVAVEAFEASHSAWERLTKDDLGNGARSRLLHGIRTLREACLKTLDNPELVSDAEALKSISETMARLTAEMDRHRTARKHGDLLALEQDLTIMERQLFLQPLSATKELT